MKVQPSRSVLALALAASVLLSGCWSRREIQELGFVLNLAIDWNAESEQYDVTAQLARPGEVPSPGGGGGGGDVAKSAFFVQVSGPTIAHAIRELRFRKSRAIFFGHLQSLVIGEEAARRGVGPIVDYVWRNQEIRPTLDVLVAKGSAREVIAGRPALEYLPGRGLPHLMERASSHSTAPRVPLARFMYAMLQSGRAAVLPLVELKPTGSPDPQAAPAFFDPMIMGVALFDLDVMVRALDREESLGLMWALGEVKRATLTYPDPAREGEVIAIRIRKTGRQISLIRGRNGLPGARLTITAVGDFLQGERIPQKLTLESVERFEREAERRIKESVEAAIAATKEVGSDVIGFGEVMRTSATSVWKGVAKDWDETYPRLPVTVEVRVEIKRTGMLR